MTDRNFCFAQIMFFSYNQRKRNQSFPYISYVWKVKMQKVFFDHKKQPEQILVFWLLWMRISLSHWFYGTPLSPSWCILLLGARLKFLYFKWLYGQQVSTLPITALEIFKWLLIKESADALKKGKQKTVCIGKIYRAITRRTDCLFMV